MTLTFVVTLKKDDNHTFLFGCTDLPEVHSFGTTMEDAIKTWKRCSNYSVGV